MKIFITFFTIVVLLISCNNEQELLEYSQENADQFIEKYSSEFLSDQKLCKYSYHPRAQFNFTQDSINKYRISPRENYVTITCYTDSCELNQSFNTSPLVIEKGEYILKKDSIIKELSYDSVLAKFHQFKQSPLDYFHGLKKRLRKFGIFAYYVSSDKSFIIVFISDQFYLIHSKEVKKHIDNDEIIKTYKENWYFVKMYSKMDLG